jgi:hypothetical protein
MLNHRKILSEYLEPLFLNENVNSISLSLDPKTISNSPFVYLIRTFALTPSHSRLNIMFKRICVQLSDMSERLCSNVLKTLLDYAIELLDQIKSDNILVQTGMDTDELNTTVAANTAVNNNVTANLDASDPNDDSIYDTKSLIDELENNKSGPNDNQSVSNGDEEISKMLFDSIDQQAADAAGSIAKEDEAINNENDMKKPVLNKKEDLNVSENAITSSHFDKSYLKTILNSNFSVLVQFLVDLLEIKRPDCEINPIRVKIYHLIQNSNNQSAIKLRNYAKFLNEMVKYCNQSDLNPALNSDATALVIQESVFNLIEAILRHLPNLFIDNLTSQSEYSGDNKDNIDENVVSKLIFDSNSVVKMLIDHLTFNKLDSMSNTIRALNCLILINKQTNKYYIKHQINQQGDPSCLSLIKCHLKWNSASSMVNFLNELIALVQRTTNPSGICLLVDLLAKFFIYVYLLVEDLYNSTGVYFVNNLT